MIIRIGGVNRVKAKGSIYYYHRKTRTRLPGKPGDAAFMAALAALNSKQGSTEDDPVSDGTFAGLARAYLESPEFEALAERTRKDYRKVLDYLNERMGKVPLAKIDAPS